MAKIWLDIDDKVLALVQQHAREIGITVEGLIAEHLGGNGTAKMPTKVASSGRVPIGAIRSRNRTSLPLKGGGSGWGSV